MLEAYLCMVLTLTGVQCRECMRRAPSMVAMRSVPTVLTTSALGWEDSSNQIFGLLIVDFTSVAASSGVGPGTRASPRDPEPLLLPVCGRFFGVGRSRGPGAGAAGLEVVSSSSTSSYSSDGDVSSGSAATSPACKTESGNRVDS